MTTFEKRFLSCRPDPAASAPNPLDGLALSPGPSVAAEPLFSYDASGIEEYPEGQILETLASLDGVACLQSGLDSAWVYRWTRGERSIEIVQTADGVFEQDGEAIWLGSELRANCTFADLVRFWNALRAHHPAIWLFNRHGRMHTPQSFLEECALPALCRAAADGDPASHELARETFAEYASLAGATRQYDARWRQAAAHVAPSAFALHWPLVELTGSARLHNRLDRKLRHLDQALTEAGVKYYAHPAMHSGSRRGIAVWVSRSSAEVARSILERLG